MSGDGIDVDPECVDAPVDNSMSRFLSRQSIPLILSDFKWKHILVEEEVVLA